MSRLTQGERVVVVVVNGFVNCVRVCGTGAGGSALSLLLLLPPLLLHLSRGLISWSTDKTSISGRTGYQCSVDASAFEMWPLGRHRAP